MRLDAVTSDDSMLRHWCLLLTLLNLRHDHDRQSFVVAHVVICIDREIQNKKTEKTKKKKKIKKLHN